MLEALIEKLIAAIEENTAAVKAQSGGNAATPAKPKATSGKGKGKDKEPETNKDEEFTLDDLKKLFVKLSEDTDRDTVIAVLSRLGCKKVSDIPPDLFARAKEEITKGQAEFDKKKAAAAADPLA